MTTEMWRSHFTRNAADMLAIAAFAIGQTGGDRDQFLQVALRYLFRTHRGSGRINTTTVERALSTFNEEISR